MGVGVVLLLLLTDEVSLCVPSGKRLGITLGFDSFSKKLTKALDKDSLGGKASAIGESRDSNQLLCCAWLRFTLLWSCSLKSRTVAIIFNICFWSLLRFLLDVTNPMIRFFTRDLSTFPSV